MGSDPDTDDPARVVPESTLEQLATGEIDLETIREHTPEWGRRTALAALGATGAAALFSGSASAATPQGTIGPADRAVLTEIDGDICVGGEPVTDLLEVRVYASASDIPDSLPEGVVALHG